MEQSHKHFYGNADGQPKPREHTGFNATEQYHYPEAYELQQQSVTPNPPVAAPTSQDQYYNLPYEQELTQTYIYPVFPENTEVNATSQPNSTVDLNTVNKYRSRWKTGIVVIISILLGASIAISATLYFKPEWLGIKGSADSADNKQTSVKKEDNSTEGEKENNNTQGGEKNKKSSVKKENKKLPQFETNSYYSPSQFKNMASVTLNGERAQGWDELAFIPYSKSEFSSNNFNLSHYDTYRKLVDQRERIAFFNIDKYKVEAHLYYKGVDVKSVAADMWNLYTRDDFSTDGKGGFAKKTVSEKYDYGTVKSELICSADPDREKYCGYEVIFANIRLWITIPSADKGSQEQITSYYKDNPPTDLIEKIVSALK